MIDTEKLDKLQRYSRTIAALGLALFFALIVISLWSLWRVRKEVADLEDRKKELALEVQKLEAQREKLEAQYELASSTLKKIAVQRPESVKEAINQTTAEQPDKPATGRENKRLEYTKQAIEQLVQAAPSVARNLPRIYLHITNEKQRPRALRIAGQLKQAGYLVPSVEDVSDRKLRMSTQVRYYAQATDAEKAGAEKIRDMLRDWGIKAETQSIRDPSRPWQYEIWFGSDFN